MKHNNKIMSIKDAVSKFVRNGSHICIGGFTLNRNPMAAVYEIIRQKISGLHLYVHSNGQGADELIGAGAVSAIELAYAGTGRFAPTCIRFAKAACLKTILIEDYSNYQMTLRFMAGAMGVPFLPTTTSLGSDIIEKWGFSADIRKKNKRLPADKLIVIDNPFEKGKKTSKVVLVPAINPDVAIIHAQTADSVGNVRIEGLTFSDIEQAKAAKHLIVTCEEIVEPQKLKNNSGLNTLPGFCVDAVILAPYGAYPTACYKRYDYDPEFLKMYEKYAKDDSLYNDYLDKYIYKTKNHADMLEKNIGAKRLEILKADPDKGYSTKLYGEI